LKYQGTLLLSREVISQFLSLDDSIAIVEEAFRLHGTGKSLTPDLMHIDSGNGEFHIKAGGLELNRRFFGLKVNGGFFSNARLFGMPNIQGLIVLCDGETGYPLAILDSREITRKRTGAATAVAARYLARVDSTTVTICGSGAQARIQLQALTRVLPITNAFVASREELNARLFAVEMSEQLGIAVEPAGNVHDALRQSQVCVTCTPAHRYFLSKEDVPPGMFIAAVGADSPDKQELDPELVKSSKVVVDILEQCARVGELHHALEAGMKKEQVHAELSQIVLGEKPGRESEEEITLFDSTGTALQDVAAAAMVYKKAVEAGVGRFFDFFLQKPLADLIAAKRFGWP
jgi:ornithine cyclodeaminase/alanine dehydrogenase